MAEAAPGHLGVGGLKFGAPLFLKLVDSGAKTDARHRMAPGKSVQLTVATPIGRRGRLKFCSGAPPAVGLVQAVFEQPHVNFEAYPPPTSESGKKMRPYLFLKRGVNLTAVAILYGFDRDFVQNN